PEATWLARPGSGKPRPDRLEAIPNLNNALLKGISPLLRLRYLVWAVLTLGVAAGWAAFAYGAGGSKAAAHVTVLAKDAGVTIAPNKYMHDNMSFSPGTAVVK